MADDCHDGLVTRQNVLADQERDLPGLRVEEPGPVDDGPFKLPERRGLGCRILVEVIVFVYSELYVAGNFDAPAPRDLARLLNRPGCSIRIRLPLEMGTGSRDHDCLKRIAARWLRFDCGPQERTR
jgi:hypothetical protein